MTSNSAAPPTVLPPRRASVGPSGGSLAGGRFAISRLFPQSLTGSAGVSPASTLRALGLSAIAVFASPAVADEIRFAETPEGITAFYHNELTQWVPVLRSETFIFDSSLGPVVMRLTRTPNDSCVPMPCADTLEVLETPPGMVAIPAQVELPELANTEIRIITFNGT
jgi:hypothetical protein